MPGSPDHHAFRSGLFRARYSLKLLAVSIRFAGRDSPCPAEKAVFQDVVQRMLYACEALGRIIVFIMDMQIVVFYRLLDLFAQQVIVNERLGRFAGELHHHAGGRVGIHIGILAGDVVGFDIDDLPGTYRVSWLLRAILRWLR